MLGLSGPAKCTEVRGRLNRIKQMKRGGKSPRGGPKRTSELTRLPPLMGGDLSHLSVTKRDQNVRPELA